MCMRGWCVVSPPQLLYAFFIFPMFSQLFKGKKICTKARKDTKIMRTAERIMLLNLKVIVVLNAPWAVQLQRRSQVFKSFWA